ncbi:MAG: beta-galactosidase GalB [Desulfobacteraceae bacterium]
MGIKTKILWSVIIFFLCFFNVACDPVELGHNRGDIEASSGEFNDVTMESTKTTGGSQRQHVSINNNWRFYRYDSLSQADTLGYDQRDDHTQIQQILKSWILPSGNDFISDPEKHYVRPEGDPGSEFSFVQSDYDDDSWETVNLPHDWAIGKSFYQGEDAAVGGSMGRLPSHGVAWYRKKLNIPATDAGKSIFLDIDGAMSYAVVWLNGHLAGGWPYGYASWRVDLTPYVELGGENQLAIRLDNPNESARWYPGGGLYRNVWLTKTDPVHVGQWGVYVTTRDVSEDFATVDLEITVDNDSAENVDVEVITEIFALNDQGGKEKNAVATTETIGTSIETGKQSELNASVTIENPQLWGPPPTQTPNLYMAVTTVLKNGEPVDEYETRFGVRKLTFDPDNGMLVNGELIKIKGVNQHHDLGALGAAFNVRAAERQLEILREMGCNAIRTAHNPPAPELLELTDKMGFLVMDEIFDVWERKKTAQDFHLVFPDWYEQDLRAFIRRDRNCPSVIMWSFGNEVGEQFTDNEGAAVAQKLHDITKDEDPSRLATTSMNWAKPDMTFPEASDVISLNYQGEGIRQEPIFEGTSGIHTPPLYQPYHEAFPDKVILSSETSAALSSRGVYLFPVTAEIFSPVRDGMGGDASIYHVSAYELYATDFGASVDKVFRALAHHSFVAGQFVWTGWDYLGEPTPYYECRSSYFGIIDLAGFKKDRFYLYQSQWLPDLPMAHILPHWNWPDRVGEVTPVHVFTSGDEAELFLNGESLGRKQLKEDNIRLRWDDILYEPGELKVVAYKNGEKWAEDIVHTTGDASALDAFADRNMIQADGKDLAFITVRVTDDNGLTVPDADNTIEFKIAGHGEIVATDNGDPTDFEPFLSHQRNAFSGLALVIVRSKPGETGPITITTKSNGLTQAKVVVNSQ